jgi:hypothetical protein
LLDGISMSVRSRVAGSRPEFAFKMSASRINTGVSSRGPDTDIEEVEV